MVDVRIICYSGLKSASTAVAGADLEISVRFRLNIVAKSPYLERKSQASP